jgi:prevent-host-death family protein
MATLSAFEAKTRFGELLDRAARGEEIVITRHDKPVARIAPEGQPSLETIRRATAGLEALQAEILRRCGGHVELSDADARSAIEAGRS